MTPEQEKFVNLFFEEGESICVSHNKYGYHSVKTSTLYDENIDLVAPEPKDPTKKKMDDVTITPDMVNMIALNPIEGFREDVHCTSFRSFLVEMDDGGLKEQMQYIKNLGLPYSCCIFSGSKSLHFGIALDTPLPSLDIYRKIATWILNIAEKADQKTKNPSRSIRFPGNLRRVYGYDTVPMEQRKEQKLIEVKGRVSQKDLFEWLNKFKDKKPKTRTRNKIISGKGSFKNISPWVKKELKEGIPAASGRNNTWYAIGFDFCMAGYTLDDTYSILEKYYSDEYDFNRREWEYVVKNGYNKALES